ncbi:hypothetical protein BC827DRAFT_1202738 [Russula dissimulans]|nr:hypothetical protein BC827DRAFT_1202738 [Russula dissimulans]
MQSYLYSEVYRMSRTQVNEVHLNGSGNQYPPNQSEAMQNVYYWYDGYMPYCTDAAASQPVDDTFLYMNVPGYSSVDKSQGVAYPLTNIHYDPHVDLQGSSQLSYTLQLWDQPTPNPRGRTPSCSTTSSPCTSPSSPSSLHWSDSEPSPTQRKQTLDDVTVSSIGPLSVPETAPSGGAQAERDVEAPGPRRPSIASTKSSPLEPDSTTAAPSREAVGRRAPKQRRGTRAVQPLACFFCRGRKIACGPATNLGSGDRTCEPCARRRLVCEYPAESYRGRRSPGSKTTTVKSQRR